MKKENQINTFLKCDPIKGGSLDEAHKEWIGVLYFSHGVSQPTQGVSGRGGHRSGRAQFAPFKIKKYVDNSSVDLNMFCTNGTHLAKVEIEVCKILKSENICYLKYELDNVMIQSVSIEVVDSDSDSDIDLLIETVEFVYSAISWAYTPVEKEGELGATIGPKKWNLENNRVE
ncbi:MAG: type VI secretion system tube protein Hcp [Candidatus Omnitrophica bacterium]|nr:type VI secretion system tube protein Hcp [Candidatus Omnitrophota bacterium]MCP5251540.1 type VI secretion system tube protein Hcp [Burkholderiales bacterium]